MQVYTIKTIKDIIDSLNINVSGLARSINMPASTLRAKLSGERKLNESDRQRITKFFTSQNIVL